jgi:hypothetical protein
MTDARPKGVQEFSSDDELPRSPRVPPERLYINYWKYKYPRLGRVKPDQLGPKFRPLGRCPQSENVLLVRSLLPSPFVVFTAFMIFPNSAHVQMELGAKVMSAAVSWGSVLFTAFPAGSLTDRVELGNVSISMRGLKQTVATVY